MPHNIYTIKFIKFRGEKKSYLVSKFLFNLNLVIEFLILRIKSLSFYQVLNWLLHHLIVKV